MRGEIEIDGRHEDQQPAGDAGRGHGDIDQRIERVANRRSHFRQGHGNAGDHPELHEEVEHAVELGAQGGRDRGQLAGPERDRRREQCEQRDETKAAGERDQSGRDRLVQAVARQPVGGRSQHQAGDEAGRDRNGDGPRDRQDDDQGDGEQAEGRIAQHGVVRARRGRGRQRHSYLLFAGECGAARRRGEIRTT